MKVKNKLLVLIDLYFHLNCRKIIQEFFLVELCIYHQADGGERLWVLRGVDFFRKLSLKSFVYVEKSDFGINYITFFKNKKKYHLT